AILTVGASMHAARAQRPTESTFDRSRPAGAVVYTVDSTEIMSSGARTLSEVLQARVPGLSILKSGGAAGQGSVARIRGTRSFAVGGDPVVIIDGVRVDVAQDATVIALGVSTSRLDDIAPEDIARIDVLPGAASAGEYGPGAASGALVITTKRGIERGLHISSRAQSSIGIVATSFPTNYWLEGIDATSGQPTHCVLLQAGAGQCTPTRLDTYNPLENASPFRAARSIGGALAVDGGIRSTTARLGVSGDRTLGVTSDDDAGRLGVRANVSQQIGEGLRLSGNGGYVQRSTALPPRGDALYNSNVIARGLFGSGARDTLDGYLPAQFSGSGRETARHWMGGATVEWNAFNWIQLAGVYGVDHVSEQNDRIVQQLPGSSLQSQLARFRHGLTTVAISAGSREWNLGSPSLRTRTFIGYSQLRSSLTAFDSIALVGSSPPIFGMSGMGQQWRVAGSSLRQELAWTERLHLGAGIRWERWSEFGAGRPGHFFRSADASWLAGRALGLDSLRLRAAYGDAGNWSPGDPQRITAPSFPFGPDPSQFAPAERVKEGELGLDFTLTHHAAVSLTAFRTDAVDLYDFQAPNFFPTSHNVAAVQNVGVELSSRLALVRASSFGWNAVVRASVLRDRVRSLGPLTNTVVADRGFEHVGSRPNSYFVTSSYTYADANRDGIIESSELQFSRLFASQAVGSSLPSREASLLSTWTIGRTLTLSGLVDYRGGQKLANLNEASRCARYQNCRGANDQSASLADQAQAAAGFSLSPLPFVDGASFVKLREVSLRWIVPSRVANWVGGPATVTIAGRNLATWTRYRGLDPELNSQSLLLPRADLAETPIPHELLLRLDLGGVVNP
ncbi:MAG TPA: TonB-dependent receptor plug domain-containing protein, partial [Gemmatimonadaceae bacterium]|nr:TonB-dependent receptor plug domain-containing protein [Gemmatimonadaceae bacterium]